MRSDQWQVFFTHRVHPASQISLFRDDKISNITFDTVTCIPDICRVIDLSLELLVCTCLGLTTNPSVS